MTYSIKSLIENLLSELGKNDIQYKGKISKLITIGLILRLIWITILSQIKMLNY